MSKRWYQGSIIAVTLLIFAGESFAIPAFARKYETSCATCHEAFPRLSAVGEAFRLNGYKFADDDLYIKDEPVEMGDEAYKKVWPKAIWPSDIPGLPPLAVVMKSKYEIDTGGTKDARTQFVFPESAKLLGAGSFGDRMSFFFELRFVRDSGSGGHGGHGATSEGTMTDLEGWLMFEDLIGPENAVNLRVGTVGMHELGLFNARDHNRLSVNPYLYSSWTMPSPSHHFHEALGLEEDDSEFSGNPFMVHAAPGIEINGFGERWRYAVGTVNGNGDEVKDNNSEKDIYWQAAYKIGGLGFDGSGGSESDELSDSESWRDDNVMLSTFGYWGTSRIDISGVDEISGDAVAFKDDDRFWRIGFAVQGKYRDFAARGGAVFGRNENPYGALSGDPVDSCSWFGEVEYFAYPWLIPYIRYEGLSLDLPSGVEGIDPSQDRNRLIVGAKALIRANVSLTIEGRFHTKDERGEGRDDDDQIVAALEAAF